MFEYENKYIKNGYKLIAGTDEAGRGPLAGPVVVACVIMPLDDKSIIQGINDSKKLSEKKREELYNKIINVAECYSVSVIDNATIDKINILNATKLGMEQCVKKLSKTPDVVLVDAVTKLNLNLEYVSIIKGDELSYSIAAASILAKVTRDRIMREYDIKFPAYKFLNHKGYGTKQHIEALKRYGKCEIHRNTFIKNFVVGE